MAPAHVTLASASNTAFYAIFGVFVAAMLVLVVIVIVWAVRHDVAGRRAWRERQQAGQVHPRGRVGWPPPEDEA